MNLIQQMVLYDFDLRCEKYLFQHIHWELNTESLPYYTSIYKE